VKNLGSKLWALGGLNQKSKNTFCGVPHGELTAKNGSIPSRNKKRRCNLKERDRQRDRQRRGDQYTATFKRTSYDTMYFKPVKYTDTDINILVIIH